MSAIPDNCFDLIIDKGLLDSQLCAETNIDDVTTLVKEMYRVLSPGREKTGSCYLLLLCLCDTRYLIVVFH